MPKPPRPVWSEIHAAQRQGVLGIGARWLLGAPVDPTKRALSDLAEGCLAAAVECAAGETGVAPPAVLAWGRFGAREAELVHPLQLLLVDGEGVGGSEPERRAELALLAERLLEELPQGFEAGLSYSLGPNEDVDPRAAACVQSLATALAFWRGQPGVDRRSGLVSLRHVAGSAAWASEFEREIGLLLDRDATGEGERRPAHERRARGELGDPLARDEDLLAGPCGIGVLERIVRTLQMAAGERAEARTSAALEGLAREHALADSAERLADAYAWLGSAELALGLLGATAAVLPSDAERQLAVARTMGYADSDATRALSRFLVDWRGVRDQVHEAAERFRREMDV